MVKLKIAVHGLEYDLSKQAHLAAKFTLGELDKITIDQYKRLMHGNNLKPKSNDGFVSQIIDRGDILHLPDANKLGIDGNLAWVRHIWQIKLECIAIRTSEARDRPAERVARLESPYRYRLTQKLGQVFSDIGLPNLDRTSVKNAVTGALQDA